MQSDLIKNIILLSRLKKYRNKKKLNELIHWPLHYFNDLDEFFKPELDLISESDNYKLNNEVFKTLEILEKKDIKIVTFFDDKYPILLRKIDDPPLLLTYKGDLDILNKNVSASVIGTRKPSPYGLNSSIKISRFFASLGINIVSGLAEGCDAGAHLGALDVLGKTTAVLGTPLNKIYPAVNKELANNIEKTGLLISEYLPYDYVFPTNFIYRDRLQAGLSMITILIESGIKGGSMHTINYAMEYNRLISALEHPKQLRSDKSDGNISLIEDEIALPFSNLKDIIILLRKLVGDFSNNVYYSDVSKNYIESLDSIIKNFVSFFEKNLNDSNI